MKNEIDGLRKYVNGLLDVIRDAETPNEALEACKLLLMLIKIMIVKNKMRTDNE